jgi:uncharacterized membrane protein YeaQ/YmgE (transglycosylase-associated protein family)
MFSFIWWLIIGLIAGALARLLVPGRQAMGIFYTMILGLVGSIVGGFLGAIIFGYNLGRPGFHPGGLVLSTIGAIIVLAIYVAVTNNRRIEGEGRR